MPCAARATVCGLRRVGDTGAAVREGISGLLSQPLQTAGGRRILVRHRLRVRR